MSTKISSIRIAFIAFLMIGTSMIALGCAKVAPRDSRFWDYIILGEVNHPGSYEYDGIEQTLLTIIDGAGGMTEKASPKRVQVVRSGTTNYYNVRHIRSGVLVDPSIPLRSVVRVKGSVE